MQTLFLFTKLNEYFIQLYLLIDEYCQIIWVLKFTTFSEQRQLL